jgi:acyl dehydratase
LTNYSTGRSAYGFERRRIELTGLFYDEYEVGRTYRHSLSRTVTETDAVLFTSLCMNTQPLHLSEEFAKTTIYGRRVVPSTFTLGLVMGMAVPDLFEGTSLGNLSMGPVDFPAPVFIGDTIRAETTVTEKRPSRSRPGTGIVGFEHRGFNQDETLVIRCVRLGLALYAEGSVTPTRGRAPRSPR